MDHLLPSSSSSVCALLTQTHSSKIVLRWRCVCVGTEFHPSTALVIFRVCLCSCDCLLMLLLLGKQHHSFLTSYILNKVHRNGKSGLLTNFKLLNFRSFSFIWVLVGAGGISLSVSLHLPHSLSLSSSPPLSLYLFCVCIRAGLACLTIWKSYWKLSDRPIDNRFLWSVWHLMEGSSCQFCVFFLGGPINFCPWYFTDTEYFFSFFRNANL